MSGGARNLLPAHAGRWVESGEKVLLFARPKWLASQLLAVLAGVSLCLLVYAVVIEPGFARLLSLPACPVLGGLAANLVLRPVVMVTDRRVVFARRFHRPVWRGYERLASLRVHRPRLGHLLRFGTVTLLFPAIRQGLPPGAYETFELSRLPDPDGLAAAVIAAASASGIGVELRGAGRG